MRSLARPLALRSSQRLSRENNPFVCCPVHEPAGSRSPHGFKFFRKKLAPLSSRRPLAIRRGLAGLLPRGLGGLGWTQAPKRPRTKIPVQPDRVLRSCCFGKRDRRCLLCVSWSQRLARPYNNYFGRIVAHGGAVRQRPQDISDIIQIRSSFYFVGSRDELPKFSLRRRPFCEMAGPSGCG